LTGEQQQALESIQFTLQRVLAAGNGQAALLTACEAK
jgi:hypothetical protein